MKRKTLKKVLVVLFGLAVLLGGAFMVYVSDAYEPQQQAIDALATTSKVEVVEEENYFSFQPEKNLYNSGFVFYQGGKVEEEAYAPLMQRIAEKGIAVYLMKMPLNLAVFDSSAAEEVIKDHGEIENWYLSGHSLGGVMASSFAEIQPTHIKGVVFMASYPAGDLSQTSLDILSIYGTNDEVLNKDAYSEAFNKLLVSMEIVIEGGNHAQFGNYGNQAGDGKASISAKEQQEITANAVLDFVQETAVK